MRRLVLTLALLAFAAAASAQLYRWTDEQGKVHFGDTPPPPGARNVQKKGGAPGVTATEENVPFALRQPLKEFPVTLYSAPSCNGCGPARALLNARGIPFKEISVRTNEQIIELNKAAGENVVPALLVGPTAIRGFDEDSYHRVLDVAGYPKIGALPARHQMEPKAAEDKSADKPAAEPPAKKGRYYSGG